MTYIEQLAQQIIKDRVVIKCESREHGAEIVKAFKERGFPIINSCPVNNYYGIFDKNYPEHCFQLETTQEYNCTILTIPEFIARYPLEPREIVGWKSKEEFRNHLIKLFGSILVYNESESPCIDLKSDSPFIELMRNLSCLELWFNPVYKEVEIPPKGTPVLDSDGRIYISKGETVGNELYVCDSIHDLCTNKFEARLSTWTVYKGGEQ